VRLLVLLKRNTYITFPPLSHQIFMSLLNSVAKKIEVKKILEVQLHPLHRPSYVLCLRLFCSLQSHCVREFFTAEVDVDVWTVFLRQWHDAQYIGTALQYSEFSSQSSCKVQSSFSHSDSDYRRTNVIKYFGLKNCRTLKNLKAHGWTRAGTHSTAAEADSISCPRTV
jgi:hypothetical protein